MKVAVKYLIGVCLWLIVFIIIRNVHSSYVADFFSLANFTSESTHEYFKLICEITASIFAILLAVITFGFELLGKNSRRRKRFNFLSKWWVSFVISVPVVIIIFSLYSAFSIQNLNQTNDLTTTYFLGIMFVCFVLSLFPFTVFLISKTDTVNDVKKLISQFTEGKEFDSEITNELFYYIQEFDRDAYNNHLLSHLSQHCLSLIGDASNRQKVNSIFQSLTKVWEAGNIDATRINEQQYFVSVWLSVKDIYVHAAKHKSFLLHYQAIEDFIRIQVEYLAVNNSIEGLSSAAKTLSEIYLHQLKYNCPKQETIRDLYWANGEKEAPNPSMDSDLQWDHINNILWQLHQLQKGSIELKSKHLYETVKFELSSILFSLRYNYDLKLGDYQESYIVYEIFSFQKYYAETALEKRMFQNSVEAFHFSVHEIADYIKKQKIFAADLVKQIEDYLLYCQKYNYLDDFMSIRDLGGLARVISMEYTNNATVQNEFLSIVEILAKLKTEIEKQVNFSENKNHNEIKRELESLKDRVIKMPTSPKSQATINRIDEIIKSF